MIYFVRHHSRWPARHAVDRNLGTALTAPIHPVAHLQLHQRLEYRLLPGLAATSANDERRKKADA